MDKATEALALAAITVVPKLLARGAVFRRLHRIAQVYHLPFHNTTNVMAHDTLNFIAAQKPHLIVSLFHQIIRRPLIAIPSQAIVNIHPGLLPAFKGIQPYFWELCQGSPEVGATIHLVRDESIDTGDIVGQASFAPLPRMSVQLVYYLTAKCASCMLPSIASAFESGSLSPRPQGPGTYYQWPTTDAYRQLYAKEHSLWCWRDLKDILLGTYDNFTPDKIGIEKSTDIL